MKILCSWTHAIISFIVQTPEQVEALKLMQRKFIYILEKDEKYLKQFITVTKWLKMRVKIYKSISRTTLQAPSSMISLTKEMILAQILLWKFLKRLSKCYQKSEISGRIQVKAINTLQRFQ